MLPVHVAVTLDHQTISISVTDRGAGLSAAEQRDIFRKFVRGSAARALNVKGTGLGLAIVDRVVRAHHGRIRVESAPGTGTRFTISLPRDAGGQPEAG